MSTKPEPVCNGGECDKRKTCKHAIVYVWDDHKIYSVQAGGFCGFYVNHTSSENSQESQKFQNHE